MNPELTNFTKSIDTAFLFIIGVATLFLVALTIVLIVFIYKYNKKRNPVPSQIKGNNFLEVLWTVIPVILVLIMFYLGWKGWDPAHEKAPNDAMIVKTTARMWSWGFQYPNGRRTDTLYLPVGKPVKLQLEAKDVIHSLFIPAFKLKQDLVPGKSAVMWFIPERVGTYDLFCSQYCGLRHSYMITSVVAMNDSDFHKWYAEVKTQKTAVSEQPGLAGLEIIKKNGCLACHSLDGTKIVGPTYKGLYGHKVLVTTNDKDREIVADDAYIKRSIYEPNADIVKGYAKNMMQSYKDMISEQEIKQIIDYMKTLK